MQSQTKQGEGQIRLNDIHYIGHILNENGLKPDPHHLHDEESRKQQLRRFLGMVTCVAKFIPNLSQHLLETY